MCFARLCCCLVVLLVLAGCGDNLFPSGEDKRPPVQSGTTGPAVGQNSPDFNVADINGNAVTLASALSGKRGIVFYFTMWCPICDAHMSNLRANIIPLFPDISFYAVDYVSGTIADAASAAASSGYAGPPFIVLADTGHTLVNGYQGTMGTTVVVDAGGVVRMNEDYKDGDRLHQVLTAIP